jgi:argininosuccinate lyase
MDTAARELGVEISFVEKGLNQEKIHEALDVNYSIALRRAPGGPAPFATRIAIEECKKQLDTDSAFIDERLAHLARAKDEVITEARRLVA